MVRAARSHPVSPEDLYQDIMPMHEEEFEEIECGIDHGESVPQEAAEPLVLRDPGTPTEREVAEHNVTHLPHRSWCAACVGGRGRDRQHRRQAQEDKKIPQVVFDYGFLGTEGEKETVAVQIAKDTRTKMHFAHVVPKKGLVSNHGAQELLKDIERLGYQEVCLKFDGEPALKAVQEDVQKRREKPTLVENSPVGDSQANGVAERAVQAVAQQLRVLRAGLEQRIEAKVPGSHPIVTWIVEHAADLLNRYQIGEDGKTPYQRLRGKVAKTAVVEFGEKVRYKINMKNHVLMYMIVT